jgi:flagellar motor protein MotB
MVSACAATVPETQYQADLQSQQSTYERRLRRLQEAKTAVEDDSQRRLKAARLARHILEKEREALELALAEKQRLIRVLSESGKDKLVAGKVSASGRKVFRRILAKLGSFQIGRILSKAPGIRWRVPADLFFEPGTHRLRKAGQSLLQKLAQVLSGAAVLGMQIEVALDSSGPAINEWALSAAQGQVLVEALSALGADASVLSFVALGKFSAVAPSESEEGRRQNRRIDFVIRTLRTDPFQGTESVEGE